MELVPALGAGGRAFKSPRPDQENQQFADHQLKHLHFEHQALPFQVNRICTLRDALCQNFFCNGRSLPSYEPRPD